MMKKLWVYFFFAALPFWVSACKHNKDGDPPATSSPSETTNAVPVANAGADAAAAVGDTVTLDGSASSDPDQDPLTFLWTVVAEPAGSSVSLSDPTGVSPTFVPQVAGTYRFELTVSDGTADSAPDQVTITVTDGTTPSPAPAPAPAPAPTPAPAPAPSPAPVNTAPTANAGPDQSVNTGATVQLDGSASSDPEQDPLTYQWTFSTMPTGSTATLSDATAVNPTFTADVDGVYTLTLIVNDGALDSTPDEVIITAGAANSPPVANAGPDQSVNTGATVQLDGSASSDPEQDPLTYQWTFSTMPAGSTATLSDATAVNPTFIADLDGVYTLALVVNDGTQDSTPDEVTVTASAANSPPVANAGPDQNVTVGDTVSLDGSASSDADSDPLTYLWSLSSLPAGSQASLSDPSAVDPTFTADVEGTYTATLVVNDGTVDSPADEVMIVASAANAVPVADAGPDQEVTVGEMVMVDGSASTDADGDPLTYRWTMTSRPADSMAELTDADMAMASFTADKAGEYVLTLVVNDGQSDSQPDSVVVVAEPADTNRFLLLNGGGDHALAPDSAFPDNSIPASFTVEAWIYPTATNKVILSDDAYDVLIVEQSGLPNNGLGVRFNLRTSCADEASVSLTDFRGIQLNEWNHVAAVFDAGTGRLWLMINGEVSRNPEQIAAATLCSTNQQNFAVGAGGRGGINSSSFIGRIDEVRVSSGIRYPLSQSPAMPPEVLDVDASTIGLWHFDEPGDAPVFNNAATVKLLPLSRVNNARSHAP